MARSALAKPMLALDPDPPAPFGGGQRLASIDILRGLVICLMALDHVRDYFHIAAFTMNPLDVEQTSVWLYLTRWITHFCAPVFVFLAGVSAFLYGSKVDSRGRLSRFLLTRGLFLVVMEFTLINLAWNFAWPGGLPLIVIWAIGASMIVLAGLIWLPRVAVFGIGLAILALHNLLDPITPEMFGPSGWIWNVMHDQGPLIIDGNFVGFAVYPLLPWIGVMATGYGLGAIFLAEPEERARFLTTTGLAMIALFLVVRGIDLYGDPNHWDSWPSLWQTVGDFLDTTKYPPSLLYVVMTLGPAFLLLPRLENASGPVARIFQTYGRVPFFVYIAHILLAHTAMVVIGLAMGYPFSVFQNVLANPQPLVEAGWGFPLWVVYVVWIGVLVVLYPLCAWFGRLKAERRDWWLSYL